MGDLLRTYRTARGEERKDLPRVERWEVTDLQSEGQFTVGRALGQAARLRWDPLGADPPHCLVTGSTGGGKTTHMHAWSLLPALWNEHLGTDWAQTVVLDPKGGAGYDAAQARGALVVTDAEAIRDQLKSAYNDAERRNREMGSEIPLDVEDAGGFIRVGKPKIFRDLTQDQRREFEMQPRLLIIDEASDLLGQKDEGKALKATWGEARAHLRQLAQKARAAGIVLVVGLVRPDAAILDGFTRDQLQARIAVGDMGPEGFRMVLGPTLAKEAEAEGESMTPGQGWTTHIGGKRVARVYVGYVDISAYLDLGVNPKLPQSVKADIERARLKQRALPRRGRESVEAGRWKGRGQDVRAVVTGPFVRAGLRLWALRLIAGKVVPGQVYRDPRVVWDKQATSTGRCELCGRAGQLNVHHKRALWAGGADTLENVIELCQRAGKASCHGATTAVEQRIRAIRERSGTYVAGDRKWFVDLVRAVPPFAALFAAIYFTGLIEPSRWWLAATVLVLVGALPLFIKYQMREKRVIPQEDFANNPALRRQAFLEIKEGKTKRRRFWGWYQIAVNLRNERWTARRRWTLQASGYYLFGAFTPKIIVLAPAVLAAFLGVIF